MRLTRRGLVVVSVTLTLLTIGALAALSWVVGNLWWTGAAYCVGSFTECMVR